VDSILRVYVFQTANELVGEHQHCFKREPATAEVEEVFQAWSKEIKYYDVEFAFRLIGVDSGNTCTARERFIDVGFTLEDGGVDRHMLEFDSNFFPGVDVGSLCAVSLN